MLTNQQLLFAQEYLKDSNAQQAAIRAGYTPNSARKYAHVLLRKPEVQQHLNEARKEIHDQAGMELQSLLAEYAKVAFFNPRRLFDEKGNAIPFADLPPDVASAITSYEIVNHQGVATIKRLFVKDKLAALDKICKLLGYFEKAKKEDQMPPIIWVDNTRDDFTLPNNSK